ncbi:unnamed protein product [Prorocentrum cordatum]|uniref:Ammonium transporter AmtB-like domain-containing protein n=1 Tax=Prorocentrum cordatum TaxID=2364126 RepID=A0ABN9W6C3_9DINO|nr:unnamed protein product [Polarella glacialis]
MDPSHPGQQALMAVFRCFLPLWLTAGAPAAGASRSQELRSEAVGLREELRAELLVVQGGWRLAQEAAQEHRLTVTDSAMTSFWLLLCGALVMTILAGIAMLETRSTWLKNVSIALIQHIVHVYVVTPSWLLFGWALARGIDDAAAHTASAGGGFMGTDGWHAKGSNDGDADGNITSTGTARSWCFQLAFLTIVATMVSGAVLFRRLSAMCAVYTFMHAVLYHMVVARMCEYDWTITLIDFGSIDFAGSGIVHGAGSVSGLAGNIVLGPRGCCREEPNHFDETGLPLVLLCTFIPWLGWHCFNCGSTLLVAINRTEATSTGGISVFFLRHWVTRAYDVGGLCGNILTSLRIVIVALIDVFVYQGSFMLLQELKIDDSVDPIPFHGFFHCLGVSSGALFDCFFDHFHGWRGCRCRINEDVCAGKRGSLHHAR